ncbi:hypothetical protein HPB49_017648 [Dermacentor silvarum]|uniref:Uncharacterized protein n=1 Tax=Dermacentor silvarum TaxID=543639 RepID=A0ACB8D724_DERSI|nr:hypothetical protein HPB49_017648 [Dermacentor silvarum]
MGQMEEALQRASETVESIGLACGLRCSPTKSELLVFRKRGNQIPLNIQLRQSPVKEVDTIRVASKRSLPPEWQQDIITRPLPRNMHPVHHENRRTARAKAYDKYSDHAGAFFVDAAGPLHNRSTATVVHRGQVVDCISATGMDITAMEEAGIALAMRNPEPPLFSRIPRRRIAISQEVKSATSHTQYCNRLRPIVKRRPLTIGEPRSKEIWRYARESRVHGSATIMAKLFVERKGSEKETRVYSGTEKRSRKAR